MALFEGTFVRGDGLSLRELLPVGMRDVSISSARKRTGDIKKKGHSPASARTAGRKSVMKKLKDQT